MVSTRLDRTMRGTWPSIPRNAHGLNIRSGTLTRYSWKKAERKKTRRAAVGLVTPPPSNGLYRCLIVIEVSYLNILC